MPKDGSKQIRWWPPTLCWLLKFSGLNDGYGELGSSLSGNWFACCLSTTIYILMKNSTIYMAQQLAAGQTLDDPLYSILSLMHFNQWRSYGHVHYMYSVNRKSVLKVDSGRYAWLSVSTRYPHALLWVHYVMIFSTSPLPVMAASDEAGLISTVVSCINTLHSCLASLLPDQFHANDIAQMQKPGVGRLSRPPAISASLGFLSPDSWKNLDKICKKKFLCDKNKNIEWILNGAGRKWQTHPDS